MTLLEFRQTWLQIDAALQWIVALLTVQVGLSIIRLFLGKK